MSGKAQEQVLNVRTFGGLELETDPLTRPGGTWVRADNLDQFVSGSLRKIQAPLELIPGKVYDSPIVAIRNYRRTPTDDQLIIGLGRNGALNNLETGGGLTSPIGNASRFPFMCLFNGIAEGEPGDSTTAKTIQYVVFTTDTFVRKWDGVSNTTSLLGIKGPVDSGQESYVAGIGLTNEPSRGISVLASRRYRMVYWNPTTRNESSPSKDFAGPNAVTFIGNGSNVQTTSDFPYVSMVRLLVDGPTGGAVGQGYAYVRFYATRDGSDEFFLVKNMVAQKSDGSWVSADSDGALLLTPDRNNQVFDGVRDPNLDSTVAGPFGIDINNEPFLFGFSQQTPYQDALLVEPAPLPGENDPPPSAVWGAVYQGRLWLVVRDQPSKLVFSKINSFESFPPDNYFNIPADDYDPIIALDGQYQQLIIGKMTTTSRIVGTDFTDFVLTPLDPQVGFSGRRALRHVQGVVLFLSRQGLMQWAADVPTFYGRAIRPITDSIDPASKLEQTCIAMDSRLGIAVVATVLLPLKTPILILIDVSQEQPFTLQTAIPTVVSEMNEIEFRDGTFGIVMACENGAVYRLFAGDLLSDAVADTQLLPQENISQRKVFRTLKVEGLVGEWQFAVAVDEKEFGQVRPLLANNRIGVIGKAITLRFQHVKRPEPGEVPMLGNYGLEYVLIGESR